MGANNSMSISGSWQCDALSIDTDGCGSALASSRRQIGIRQCFLLLIEIKSISVSDEGWSISLTFEDISLGIVFALVVKIKNFKRHSMTFIAAGELRLDECLAIENRVFYVLLCGNLRSKQRAEESKDYREMKLGSADLPQPSIPLRVETLFLEGTWCRMCAQ